MRLDDAASLHRFELACSELDGATGLRTQADWQRKLTDEAHTAENSVIAIDENSHIAAAGRIDYSLRAEEVHAFLDGRVHPDHRGQGIGTALLGWLEARGHEHLASIADGRQQVLRILFYDRAADAVDLFERHGFRHQYAEDEMRHDLREPIPERPLPGGMTFHTWTPENASDYFKVYEDAFRTRTGSRLSKPAWHDHFANEEDEEFHPELSLLARDKDEPVAYAVCHVDVVDDGATVDEAWITQMGVRPAWRRRGIASALLAESMRRFAASGYTYAMLSVNVNNPEARRLYEQMGFRSTKRLNVYRKEIEP
ncbi:MAG: GNAT family N-acetyltransferase [Candidatus Bipolaricaulia bacterium]